jgi:hypothetical protein
MTIILPSVNIFISICLWFLHDNYLVSIRVDNTRVETRLISATGNISANVALYYTLNDDGSIDFWVRRANGGPNYGGWLAPFIITGVVTPRDTSIPPPTLADAIQIIPD